MTYIFDEKNSVLNKFIAQIRDEKIQKDSMRFRKNIERIGELAAYEISKTLSYSKTEVVTPLGLSDVYVPDNQIVIASVMRAGLPLHNGFLNIFDDAQNAFISAYRKYHDDNSFEISSEYVSSPSIEGKTLILVDPMLATGSSIIVAYKSLLKKGKPKHVHIFSIIASREGVEYVEMNFPNKKFTLWLGSVDDELTAHAYIVPGLGDAGDLAYGEK
jgi:uracil phosphoribosyltransferase